LLEFGGDFAGTLFTAVCGNGKMGRGNFNPLLVSASGAKGTGKKRNKKETSPNHRHTHREPRLGDG
jgi:hypothetical protein